MRYKNTNYNKFNSNNTSPNKNVENNLKISANMKNNYNNQNNYTKDYQNYENQDKIKSYLLKVKNVIPIGDFKQFIHHIKILTVKDERIDKNEILRNVGKIFKNYPEFFDEFETLLLFKKQKI